MKLVYDQSKFISSAIGEVREAALIGGLLAILVLYLFLRDARATFITGLAIPVSVIGTFVVMYMFDLSLNIMSLGGIALAVGMLVDNAVVVLENIVRHREEGPLAHRSRDARHQRGRHGDHGRDADVGRGLLPDGVHHRHRGPAVPRPGADGELLAPVLADRRDDAGADARRRQAGVRGAGPGTQPRHGSAAGIARVLAGKRRLTATVSDFMAWLFGFAGAADAVRIRGGRARLPARAALVARAPRARRR